MSFDPNVWLSEQPGFAAIARDLGRDPLEYAREWADSLKSMGYPPPVRGAYEGVPRSPVPPVEALPDPKTGERLDTLERKIRRQERQVSLLRDDLEMSLLEP